MEFRRAEFQQVARIMEIIEQARAFLKLRKVDQWQDGYPREETILGDILAQEGYVLMDGDRVAGYACVRLGGEECYEKIRGAWASEQPYAVLHRLAIGEEYRGRGLGKEIIAHAERLALSRDMHSFRMDTDEQNAVMRRLLRNLGYRQCGTIQFENSDKIAFEKLI